MAPLPENNTGRVLVDYTSNTRSHTAQFRYAGAGAPDAAFLTAVGQMMVVMESFMAVDYNLTGWRYVPQGGDFSIDIADTPPSVTGIGTTTLGEAPAFLSFVGRSLGGKRCRLYFIGTNVSPADEGGGIGNYRLTPSESTALQDALDILVAAPFVAIDGLEPVWKDYANAGYHSYWQKAVRS